MLALEFGPRRRMLAKSSCNSVRALSPVETLSPVMTGWFNTAADQSPESPALRRHVAVHQADARHTLVGLRRSLARRSTGLRFRGLGISGLTLRSILILDPSPSERWAAPTDQRLPRSSAPGR